jgi:hypothetical protein
MQQAPEKVDVSIGTAGWKSRNELGPSLQQITALVNKKLPIV